MKRALLHTVVLLPVLTTLPFLRLLSGKGTKTVRHTIVAVSGDAAPAGGDYIAFFSASLNARNDVVFDAFLGGPSITGVFVGDGTRTSTIALGGNQDPATTNFEFVENPFITANGDVLFDANVIGHTFISDGGTILPLVRDGNPAPDGGTLTALQARAANNHGAIAYLARVVGATGTRGIFRTDLRQTVVIARDDTAVPTGGRFISFRDPDINNRGQVAFEAGMSGGSADSGIFRGEGGNLTSVFVANQSAPGGGAFEEFGNPLINAHGHVAAAASLKNSPGSVGMFIGDGTNAVAIAVQGRPAPKGGNYVSRLGFLQPATLNDRGEVAFHVGLTGGTSKAGIFRGNGVRTTTVALEGTIAPGTTGMFEDFFDIKLRNDGRVAFIASLALGVGGVNSSNNMGIWIGKSDEDLQLVVRTGESIGGSVLTKLPKLFGQFDLNQDGVVWVGTFQSPARAIVFSRIPGEKDDADKRY